MAGRPKPKGNSCMMGPRRIDEGSPLKMSVQYVGGVVARILDVTALSSCSEEFSLPR